MTRTGHAVLIIVAIVALGPVSLFGPLELLHRRVVARIAQYEREFPIGIPLTEAKGRLESRLLKYSFDSTAQCEKHARMTSPAYTPRGGPCIFALDLVGSTWYGFDTAIQLRLMFDGAYNLAGRQFHQVHTFL
jgi:hypothetical protein